MDEDNKNKYKGYKLTVKRWEHEFKKLSKRIPSKYDIRDAPLEVRQAYKMYYRMKTAYLTETLTDVLEDDEDNLYDSSNVNSTLSTSIKELLDPKTPLPTTTDILPETSKLTKLELQEFEAAEHLECNDTAWNVNVNKPKPKLKEPKKQTFQKKLSMNIEPPQNIRPLRNPKKSLTKLKLSNNSLNGLDNEKPKDVLPDLETILLEKSRSNKTIESKKTYPSMSDLKADIDIGWLDRNTSMNSEISKTTSTVSAASSFGLSNLNMKSFTTSTSLNCPKLNAEIKFHTLDTSDLEIVGNSDEEVEQKKLPLHVAKKRRLSEELRASRQTQNGVHAFQKLSPKILENKAPEKPERSSLRGHKLTEDLNTIDEEPNNDTGHDKALQASTDEDEPKLTMKRKRSLIQRSKDGISKAAKKATKILTRGKKASVEEENHTETPLQEEQDINFLIDSDLKTLTTIPRASQKELVMTEKLFDNYLSQHAATASVNKVTQIIDEKTAAKKKVLEKKVASGTLNDNFVRVNLKKKVFVRGKKAFSFSKFKKAAWKSKKAAALGGADMRGCDGGVLKCFNCGGIGHFEQNCKQKGDNLLPVDVDFQDDSPFPSLEEAAQMANQLPQSSKSMWKDVNDEGGKNNADKENKDGNGEFTESTSATTKISYVGHKIPEDFLIKSGLLDVTVGNKDKVESVYKLNPGGSLPPAPEEVFEALKLFGHSTFRNGQEKAIMRVLCGVSTLVTLSTGSGKSLCYQLPAYLYRKKSHCITLVISPLVSLMEDQVHGIPDFVNAKCLHTNQTPKQREMTMAAIKAGEVEILLVSPETVVSGEKNSGLGSLLRQLPPIAFACIDEAHCVSQWSHNFRPSYLMICRVLREKLGVKTVLGLTATATIQTVESIVRHLEIPDGEKGIISDIPLPDNLVLTVSQDENRDRALIALLHSERFEALQSIIIYCTRRDECERIAGILRTCLQEKTKDDAKTSNKKRKRFNLNAEAYHAGLPSSRRRTIQNAFMAGELRIVIATIAFGMGINKSDIRGIIHFNMPKSFESYVQEVGRAGRDGKLSHCHVFLDSKGNDLSELRRHIYSNSIDRHVIRKLLKKVFVPCACGRDSETDPEFKDLIFEASDDEMNGRPEAPVHKFRPICPTHEVSFAIDESVQALDIPEENISTLLCYLELHQERYIKVLGNAYTKCKIISYGGEKFLKQAAKSCPPLAMAIALDLKKAVNDKKELNSIEFSVVDVAAVIGWDSGVVKYQLKQLEWTTVNGVNKRSPITVSFSDLGFRLKAPGDLTGEELDAALDSLERRTSHQEMLQLYQLQIIYKTFKSLAFSSYNQCSTNDLPTESSEKLKEIIRNYFQHDMPTSVQLDEDSAKTSDSEIASDIRQVVSMYPDNNFSGRALARLFHGISSPCYPAVIWGRCKYWRAHMDVNFKRLVALGNTELVKMRRVN